MRQIMPIYLLCKHSVDGALRLKPRSDSCPTPASPPLLDGLPEIVPEELLLHTWRIQTRGVLDEERSYGLIGQSSVSQQPVYYCSHLEYGLRDTR